MRSEVEEIFAQAPLAPNCTAQQHVREAHAKAMGKDLGASLFAVSERSQLMSRTYQNHRRHLSRSAYRQKVMIAPSAMNRCMKQPRTHSSSVRRVERHCMMSAGSNVRHAMPRNSWD